MGGSEILGESKTNTNITNEREKGLVTEWEREKNDRLPIRDRLNQTD